MGYVIFCDWLAKDWKFKTICNFLFWASIFGSLNPSYWHKTFYHFWYLNYGCLEWKFLVNYNEVIWSSMIAEAQWLLRHLECQVVSHTSICCPLGSEFAPRWWTRVQHLRFFHKFIWFIWSEFDIYLLKWLLNCENRK